jgi:hypothetical protein
MANHNKNKRFSGESFQPVRRARSVGQDALERERQRKLERGAIRPIAESDDDFFFGVTDED